MPELPEVETVVRDLRPLLVGRRLAHVEVGAKALRRRWSPDWEAALRGQKVHAIARRGKWIVVHLHEPCLLVHLGMTGQFTVALPGQERANHTHVVFTLDNAHELRFRDIRRFGSITYFPTQEQLHAFFQDSALGPEPFELDPHVWRQSLRKSRRNLKALLLDQTQVAGVGNIYADETLFEARLHPAILGAHLSAGQTRKLCRAIVTVLDRAIERRGSTIRNYVGGSGLKGGYQEEFRVYGRTGQPCSRCRTPIQKIPLAGRSTHFCPRCQPKRT